MCSTPRYPVDPRQDTHECHAARRCHDGRAARVLDRHLDVTAQLSRSELGTPEPRFRRPTGDDQRLGLWREPGYRVVDFSDNGSSWGGRETALQIDSWSDTAVTFTVPPSVSPGSPASVTVVTGSGSTSDSPELDITPTANPSDYYDDTGTSPDNNQSCANYDGVGYSYSATALASAGLTPGASVSADGLTFKWTSGAPCSPDNILAAGQTMLVSGPAGCNTLGLLESSTDGGSQGTITINYTDGTSSTATVSASDWAGRSRSHGDSCGDPAVSQQHLG